MKNNDKVIFKRDLFNPKKDIPALLVKLKSRTDFEFVFTTLTESIIHPIVKKFALSNPFPLNYSQLRAHRYLPLTGNFIGEVCWTLVPLLSEHKKLNSFLAKKVAYENCILFGEYQKAYDLLIDIQNLFGVSIWLIENLLLVAELKDGTEGNWLTVSNLASSTSDGLILYFIEHLSKKAEEKITYTRFREVLLNEINEMDLFPEFKEYILFRLNYIGVAEYYNLNYFLNVESISSLIDRYNVLKVVLCEILDNQSLNIIKKIAVKAKKFDDPFYKQLLHYSNKLNSFHFFQETRTFIEITDLYTSGEYRKCMELIKDEIIKQPQTVEYFDLYVRSNIEVGYEFINPNISPLLNKILECLFILYKKDVNTNNAIEDLLKLISIHFSTDWAKQLLGLVNSLVSLNNNKSTFYQFYSLFSKVNNPKGFNDFDDLLINKNRRELASINKDSYTIQVLTAISTGESSLLNELEIPQGKKKLYLLRSMFNSKAFRESSLLGEEILAEKLVSSNGYEEALIYTFKSYLNLNESQKALLLFVQVYLSNPNNTKRLDKIDLLKRININKKLVFDLIEYPIFFSTINSEPYELYVAYDTFMTENNLERPSEILKNKLDYPSNNLIYFFREVCTVEVLKHSYYFSSKEELEQERLLLLDELLKIDKRNEASYIKEITSITQGAAVKKAMREVNKGRVTINIEQLKDAESNNIKEGFNRYIELINFSKNRTIQGIDISGKQLIDYYHQLNDELKNKVVYTNDPAFISFKMMFLDIRDKFILSKEYGLDGYLSTRIRHGTFQNYIRSVFESENLISQKDLNGTYLDIEHWRNKLPSYLLHKNPELQGALHEFSKKVDDYTEHVIRELIQVKTEKHDKKPEALFDYSVDKVQLAQIFQLTRDKIKDHKTFINLIFSSLTNQTETILENVKKFFLKDIISYYTRLLDDLQDKIKDTLYPYSFPELTTSITRCSTLLRKEIMNIAEWFNIANPTSDLILDLRTLMQTSVEITNRIYPYKNINPIININDESIFGSINFIYIARILLDNIILHSKVEHNDLGIIIDVSRTDNDYLKLAFTNNLSPNIALDDLKDKLEAVNAKWQNGEQDFEKTDTEGGSGFDKIRRILTFDMKNKEHKFEYELIDYHLTISIYLKLRI